MKKRLIVLLIAVILILSCVLAGCNMIRLNEERDGDQVVATVKHNGLISEITKTEFTSYFIQSFQQYSSYFDWTAKEAGENFLSVLARQKMNVILAVEKVCEEKDVEVNTTKFNSIVKSNLPKNNSKGDENTLNPKGYDVYAAYLLSLLDPDEQKYVKEQTNKIFQDEYDKYIKTQLENDKIKADEENSNNNSNKTENEKSPRPTKEKEENNSFVKDSTVKQEDVDKILDFFTANKPNDKSTQYEKEAYAEREKNLKKTYLTYDYYLASQAESRLVAKYQDYFKDENIADIKVTIEDGYEETLKEQMKSYKTSSSYKSAIESGSTVIYHNGRYVRVKSILLQFSDEQKAVLDFMKSKFTGDNFEEYIENIRKALVFGTDIVDDLQLDKYFENVSGLKVYKSNPDYDSTKTAGDPANNYERDKDGNYKHDENGKLIVIKPAEEMNYPYIVNPDYNPENKDSDKWLSVPFLDIIAELGNALKEVNGKAETEYKEKYNYDEKYATADAATKEKMDIGMQMYVNQKRIELFEDWIYLVNDDSGMFEGNEYTETPVGNSSDYVVEYTALVRQLLLDNGTQGSVKVDQTGALNLNTKLPNINVTTAKVGDKEVEIYTDSTNEISFIVNDFGVHIVMLTTVPVDMGYNTEDTHFTVTENKDFDMTEFEDNEIYDTADIELIKRENSYYTLKLNAFVAFDEETGLAVTLEDKLTDELKATYDSTFYSNHSKKLFDMYGEKMFDSKDDKAAAEGYENFKFELSYKKSIFNNVVGYVKKLFKVD